MSGKVTRGDVAALLGKHGYQLGEHRLGDWEATIAATPYALVACIEIGGWDDLLRQVADVQAELTTIDAAAPSPRSWDLYLVVLVDEAATDPDQRALVEALEGDTSYTRKFVHAGLNPEELDQALRPLLPLRPPAKLEVADPLEELRAELLAIGVEKKTVDSAILSFESRNEVELA
ncbi:MAG TPA: hypothetical protein VIT89_02490 [Solirubrobacterales bacterium]